MKKAILIKADGTQSYVEPKNKKQFSYEELSGFVGGMIERVEFPNRWEIWVNEEGKVNGLPLNKRATEIWAEQFKGALVGADDVIVGDALLVMRYLKDDK